MSKYAVDIPESSVAGLTGEQVRKESPDYLFYQLLLKQDLRYMPDIIDV